MNMGKNHEMDSNEKNLRCGGPTGAHIQFHRVKRLAGRVKAGHTRLRSHPTALPGKQTVLRSEPGRERAEEKENATQISLMGRPTIFR